MTVALSLVVVCSVRPLVLHRRHGQQTCRLSVGRSWPDGWTLMLAVSLASWWCLAADFWWGAAAGIGNGFGTAFLYRGLSSAGWEWSPPCPASGRP